MKINSAAAELVKGMEGRQEELRVTIHQRECGIRIVDFGVEVLGGLEAGLLLARICMADLGKVVLTPADPSHFPSPQVQVTTDQPLIACMTAQYAGWPIQHGKFFAMGSGPMRALRGRERMLETLGLRDESSVAVGVLECDQLPDDEVCQKIAEECGLSLQSLILCIAPTRSIAGTIQVVARSIETSLHKLHELGFDLRQIVSGHGSAPLPPPARDFVEGIGRSNDAILYGGHVTLWVDSEDSTIADLGPKVPSCQSKDWGRPFAEVFRDYQMDFYRVDPGLFSPAEITFNNLRTGRSFRFGTPRPDVLAKSFHGP